MGGNLSLRTASIRSPTPAKAKTWRPTMSLRQKPILDQEGDISLQHRKKEKIIVETVSLHVS